MAKCYNKYNMGLRGYYDYKKWEKIKKNWIQK